MLVRVPTVLSVMRNVSVPYGISTPDRPHIASTRWRSVCNQKDKVYYFEPTLNFELFWVDFSTVDFREGAPELKLLLTDGETYSGNAAAAFRKADKPFVFLFSI